MDDRAFEGLPGAEIVLPGLSDLEKGLRSTSALAVQAAGPRLRSLGLYTGPSDDEVPAAHRLYRELQSELGDGAHSRYNAILSRVASFAQAAERARAG